MIYKDKNFEHLNDFEIEKYNFRTFVGSEEADFESKEFDIPEFKEGQEVKKSINKIISIATEKDSALKTGFQISPIVQEHRGHREIERHQNMRRIEKEVDVRTNQLRDQAYKDGYNEGLRQGKEDSLEQLKEKSEEKIARLIEMISNTVNQRKSLLENDKKEVYRIVKDLTKWIVLRELKSDDQYIERLIEKLIHELGEKSNLVVHVNQEQFEDMPEILEKVQEKVGNLPNVRVMVNYDLKRNGIKIESDSGIICADLDKQFENLDKIFESVGVTEEEDDGTDGIES
jgi:flagellar assembly protein FliH